MVDEHEPLPQRGWREDTNRMQTMTSLLGHTGMMMEFIQRDRAIYRSKLRAQARGSAVVDPEIDGDPEGEDMAVNIGNEFHYHVDQDSVPPLPTPTTPTTPAATPTEQSLLQRMLPYMATALAAGGIAYGVTRPTTESTPTGTYPVSQPTYVDTDTDTDTKTRIGVEVHD